MIQKYHEDYLIFLQYKIKQCVDELNTQASCWPLTLPSMEAVDMRLKEFIRLHHLDLSRTINYQINRFKDKIQQTQLLQQLSSYHLTTEHVR